MPRPRLDPSGSASPSLASALNAVRHRIRDGVPTLDTTPVPFNVVQLEELTDQIAIAATPTQTRFQVRFDDVPTGKYMHAQVVPATLVAYVDGSWTPTSPTVDVDVNGNFTLPTPPASRLLITYAYQYMSDGEVYQAIDEARQWLREFTTVTLIPDGLVPALIANAAGRCLASLASTTARLAHVRAGDSDVDWSALTKSYQALSKAQMDQATADRASYYTQGPEALDPTVADVGAVWISPYTPER